MFQKTFFNFCDDLRSASTQKLQMSLVVFTATTECKRKKYFQSTKFFLQYLKLSKKLKKN